MDMAVGAGLFVLNGPPSPPPPTPVPLLDPGSGVLSLLALQQIVTPTMHPNLVHTLKSIISEANSSSSLSPSSSSPSSSTDTAPPVPYPSSAALAAASPSPSLSSSYSYSSETEKWNSPQVAVVPVHLIQNRRPFKCKQGGCHKTFKNPQTLKMHLKTHYCGPNSGSNPYSSMKGFCSSGSSPVVSVVSSSSSSKAGQNKKIPSKCPVCRRTFVGLYELRRHYGRKHSEGEKPHGCSKCGKRFYVEVDLRDHLKMCGEPLFCKCGMKFAFKCNLVAHKKTHPSCQDSADSNPLPLPSAAARIGSISGNGNGNSVSNGWNCANLATSLGDMPMSGVGGSMIYKSEYSPYPGFLRDTLWGLIASVL